MPSTRDMQNRLSYELAVYREQVTMLKRETERVSLTALDLNNALKTVDGISHNQVLVPVGGGVLIRANISNVNVLVPIGGGYLLEMKKEIASTELQKRIEATNKAVERLTEEFNKINMKLREVSSQIGQLEAQSRIEQTVNENTKDDYL